MRCRMYRASREFRADQSKYNDAAQGKSLLHSAMFSQQAKWSCPSFKWNYFCRIVNKGSF